MLATVSNLYGYGPVTGPMTEELPLAATGRKGMVAGRGCGRRRWPRTGPGGPGSPRSARPTTSAPAPQSLLGDRVLPRLLAGRGVQVHRQR